MSDPPDDPLPEDWHPVFAVWRWHWTILLPMVLLICLIGFPVLAGFTAGLGVLLRDITGR